MLNYNPYPNIQIFFLKIAFGFLSSFFLKYFKIFRTKGMPIIVTGTFKK